LSLRLECFWVIEVLLLVIVPNVSKLDALCTKRVITYHC
jgi:competence protein ComGC